MPVSAFDSSSNLVVGQRWGALFGLYRYYDGSLQRASNVIDAYSRREKNALDGAGHVIMCEENQELVVRHRDASCVLTITQQLIAIRNARERHVTHFHHTLSCISQIYFIYFAMQSSLTVLGLAVAVFDLFQLC